MTGHKGVPSIRRKKPFLMPILAIIIIVLWVWCWWWPNPVTTVYISRHAEKLNTTSNIPLSASELLRGADLAHVLKDEGIDAVFATEFQRTQKPASQSRYRPVSA